MMGSRGLFEMLRARFAIEIDSGPQVFGSPSHSPTPSHAVSAMGYSFAVFFGMDGEGMKTFTEGVQHLEGAHAFEDVIFTYCPSEQMMSQFEAQDGSVVLFTPFDEGRHDLEPGFSEAELCLFLETYAYPLVTKLDELDEATQCSLVAQDMPCLFVFTHEDEGPQDDVSLENAALAQSLLEKTLALIGAKYRGMLKVVMVDAVLMDGDGLVDTVAEADDGVVDGTPSDVSPASFGVSAGAALASELKISAADLPMACLVEAEAPFHQYRSLGGIYAANLMAFVQSWEAGWLTPFSSANLSSVNDSLIEFR